MPAEILVVDDEPLILNLVTAVLAMSGYPVRRAATGQQGIELFRERHEQIGLVLMDATVPDVQGADLLDQFAGIAAAVPVVIMSGAGENMLDALSENPVVVEVLRKPFRNEDLAALVRKWIPQP